MTAVDRLDYELAELLDQDDALGHPSWCDRALCTVELDGDGLTGFHESRRLASVETDVDLWAAADFHISIEQWCRDDAPYVRLIVNGESGHAIVSLAPDQIGPLVDAITAAAKAVPR